MITLTVGTTSVALPEDLYWSDETTWSPVVQSVDRSLTGALLVQTALRQAGRPVTLAPPEEARSSWLSRSSLEQLQVWLGQPGQVMLLTLRGVVRSVVWRHQDGSALEARPVQHYSDVQPDDVYTATLRLMEI